MATIIIKNSTGSSAVPSSLIQGELAINTVTGKLYYGSGSGNVVKEFTGSATGGSSSFPYTGSAIITGSLIVTGSTTSTLGFTGSLFGTSSWAQTSSKIIGGTTNYIPLWSAGTTLGSSVLYQSGTSIGLGTISPNTILHISGASAQPLVNIENNTPTGYTNMRFTGTGRKYVIGVGNASESTFGIANDFFLYDDTSGNIRMIVDPNGRVGIGTVSPSTTLDVNGGLTVTGSIISTLGFTGSLLGTASLVTGQTTVGSNLITQANPSAIRYLRINADNSVSQLTLAQLQSDLGLPTTVVTAVNTTTAAGNAGTASQDIPGLSFSATAGALYEIKMVCLYDTTNTSTGNKWSISSSVAADIVTYHTRTTVATGVNGYASGVSSATTYDGTTTTGTSAFNSNGLIILEGFIRLSSNGTVNGRFATEVTTTSTTCKSGSFLQYRQIS